MTEHDNHTHENHKHHHHHEIVNISGRKILFATILNGIITLVEIIGGIFSGSLALLSDSLHNLSDTIAIALSYIANKIAQKPGNIKKTYGYKRAEILAAFINSAALMAISVMLIIEAFKRFSKPEIINGEIMLYVAIIGLLANLIAAILLKKDSDKNINIKSSYLHLIGDTVSSIGVILGGFAIKFWSITWIDPVITMIISVYILKECFSILKSSIDILMQSSADIDYIEIKKDIEKISGVKNIHHMHSWRINESTIYFEAHVEVKDMMVSQTEIVYKQIEEILKVEHGINHITVQFEINCCDNKDMIHKKE